MTFIEIVLAIVLAQALRAVIVTVLVIVRERYRWRVWGGLSEKLPPGPIGRFLDSMLGLW